MQSRLSNKVIVITGASSGIGEATARKLAAHGAKLVLAARRIDRLHRLKASLESDGCQVLTVPTDVTRQADLERLIDMAVATFGGVDILVNNAGIMPLGKMQNLRVSEWDQMIDVNLKGLLYGIAAVLPRFREQKSGHIINIGSVSGRRVYPGGVVYCATKFGVRVISEGLRRELDPQDNIRVTVIEPGAVKTELASSIGDPEAKQRNIGWTSSITLLQADDIAESIVYAASQADHVNVDEIVIMPREQMA